MREHLTDYRKSDYEEANKYFLEHIDSEDKRKEALQKSAEWYEKRHQRKFLPDMWEKMLRYLEAGSPYIKHVDTYTYEDEDGSVKWRCQIAVHIHKDDIAKVFFEEFSLFLDIVRLETPTWYTPIVFNGVHIHQTFILPFKD